MIHETAPGLGSDRRFGLWDVVALAEFEAKANEATVIRQENRDNRALAISTFQDEEPPHGHHTVPVFVCGRVLQNLSFLRASDHRVLHSQLGAMRIARTAAIAKANQTLPSIGRQRNTDVMAMADTREGRTKIANTLQRFYESKNWWGSGIPTIGAVFSNEKRLYISSRSNTSLPNCTK